MRTTWLVVVAGALACGCVYDEAGVPGVAFSVRNTFSLAEEDWLDDGTSHEVAGTVQHAQFFAMEYSAGLERYDGDTFEMSTVIGGSFRVTPMYSKKFGENFILRAGGGFTMKDLEYRLGHDELLALSALSVNNSEVDVNVAGGFHLQLEALFAAKNGFTAGLFLRHTFLDADAKWKWDDGVLYHEADVSLDLGGTEIGLSLGAAF